MATSLAGAAAAAGLPRAAFAAGPQSADLNTADLAEINGVVQQYLQARADAVTRPGSKMSAAWLRERTSAALGATISHDFDRLGGTRELVTDIHSGYSGADAEAYQQRLDHRVVVRKEGGRWTLAEADFQAGSGVPPLTQFDGYLSAAAPAVPAPAGVVRQASKLSPAKRVRAPKATTGSLAGYRGLRE